MPQLSGGFRERIKVMTEKTAAVFAAATAAWFVFYMTGCAGMATMNQDFVMAGNAEGIRAYNDGIIGAAKTAKESADADSKYFAVRTQQEAEITKREMQPNFLEGLFGKGGN